MADRLGPGRAAMRLWQTVRHLRGSQLWGRLWFRLARASPPRDGLAALALPAGPWVAPAPREPSLIGPRQLRLLGVEGAVASATDWNRSDRDKLWLYNLHYFDDLNARGGASRLAWQRALMARWVAENPPFAGNGWEPYPTSLRLVNWLKWALAGNRLAPDWAASLALQARWLARRIEWHLLGNHLFVNAKALVFAGLCFTAPEAARWRAQGLAILGRELPEQVLADGGHFERSPMYHALILEDLLDLLNLVRACRDGRGGELPPGVEDAAAAWREAAGRMQDWLAALCHPDGEIALFNDAAFGIAPPPAELFAYGARLGLPAPRVPGEGLTRLEPSGYLRLARGPAVALLDCAPIGPDYLPGHAHADTLGFELSLFGQRVLVDSGTDRYGVSPERLRQRGTAAHNTVEVDGEDSSQVWGGFRVARRAYPLGLDTGDGDGALRVACGHDGYRRLRGRPEHRREWRLDDHGLEIRDRVAGRFREAVARLLLHPDVPVVQDGVGGGHFTVAGRCIRWQTAGAARVEVVPASYHPRFGESRDTQRLEITLAGPVLTTRLTWQPD